jgi:adenine-specific DNA-methyltransferase
MTNSLLAEATAAQLGFEYKPYPPFAGQKGRTRLAVIDGVVNEGVRDAPCARTLTGTRP